MDIIGEFGKIIGKQVDVNPQRTRKLLLAGYRLQLLKLKLVPDRQLPPSGRYVAQVTMETIIKALAKPGEAAMVSIFVPGELLCAAGLTPYSVEAMSCFLAGTKCEQAFLAKTGGQGFPETMCSYHRVFLGAALAGLVPDPKCMLYTNLACDANMMTFPYLKEKCGTPAFFLDIPYEKSEESVQDVAAQLRAAKLFLEDQTHRRITDESLKEALFRSRQAAELYQKQMDLRRQKHPATTITNELYGLFMSHLLAGTEQSLTYAEQLLQDVKQAPPAKGPGICWMHIMPFLQESVKEVFNYTDNVRITACDFIADGCRIIDREDPYESMAEKMVYSVYNGSIQDRIDRAIDMVQRTGADGVILFAHWGCKATAGASALIKQQLEAAGIPTLILDGDGCNPVNASDGQMATRLQAFLEMIS